MLLRLLYFFGGSFLLFLKKTHVLGCSVHITILGGSHGSPDQRLPPKEGGGNLEQLQQNLAAAAESRWAAIGCGRL